MNDETQILLNQLTALLGGHNGWVAATLAWMGTFRLFFKSLNAVLIQPMFNRVIEYVAGTPEVDDDTLLYAVLKSKTYRFFAFLVDMITSVKLPTAQSVVTTPTQT